MVINHLGGAFIKIQQGDLTVAFSPIGRELDSKVSRFGADLALLAVRGPEAGSAETVTYSNKIPFVIDGPGEYEKNDIFIHGFASSGPEGKINTVFDLTIDGIKVCHLGLLAKADLSAETIEDIGNVDILFVPVGGGDVLEPKAAARLAAGLEPKMIIPIAYDDKGGEEALKIFLKEAAGGKENIADKLTIKRKDLEGKEAEVVVLKN